MLAALDALPAPRLIESALIEGTDCCAMGAVAMKRGQNVSDVDPYDREDVAAAFGIAEAMAAEIAYVNDDKEWQLHDELPEDRFRRVRKWVVGHIVVTPEELAEKETGERDG
jgi:hypothetical protein